MSGAVSIPTTFLLAADTGILDDRAERINRFINIPKLKGVLPMGKMIPFYITGEGISIDTRGRVR